MELRKERKPSVEFNPHMILIEHRLKSCMNDFTKPMDRNAEFSSKLLDSAWIRQALEKYHLFPKHFCQYHL